MSKVVHLEGWNVSVDKITLKEAGTNGDAVTKEGFALIFTEAKPPTGDRIIFRMPKEIAELVAGELRGVHVFGPGEMPTL